MSMSQSFSKLFRPLLFLPRNPSYVLQPSVMAASLDGQGVFRDSQLSQKFGPEIINYFSGSPLNRVSFLRSNYAFLKEALPVGNFMLLNNLDPLSESADHLTFLSYADVATFIGTPYDLPEDDLIAAFDSRTSHPLLVFLGLKEDAPSTSFTYKGDHASYTGDPYFAVDVTPHGALSAQAGSLIAAVTAAGNTEFRKTRLDLKLAPPDAAMLGQARSFIDWNARNTFCSACGGHTLSVHAGGKRACPPHDRAFQASLSSPPFERPPCISRKGVHNIAFPRSDPTVIQAIVSADGTKVLLGRQRRWPKDFHSCLAGFCEPAESVEEAVRRETWEESGVRVGRVVIHSTQPWPYPSSLMIGCVGQALPGEGERINLGHDPELHVAGWWEMGVLREALEKSSTGSLDRPPVGHKDGDIRLPPPNAIAHQLIKAVVNNYHGAPEMSRI